MSIQYATLRPALALAAVAVLAGCAGAQSDFQCDATAGDTCMTMEAANDRARELAAPVKPGVGALPSLAERHAASVVPAAVTRNVSPEPLTGGAPSAVKSAGSAGGRLLLPAPRTPMPASAHVLEACAACGNVPAVRTLAVTAGVWVAPYVDDAGVLHQPGLLSFVAVPSRWRLPADGE